MLNADGTLSHKISRPSLANVLRKVGDDFRAHIVKKVKIVTTLPRIKLSEDKLVPLETMFESLGRSVFRVSMIDEIHKKLTGYEGRMLSVTTEELWAMRELEQKMIDLAQEYIRAYLYEQDKNKEAHNEQEPCPRVS